MNQESPPNPDALPPAVAALPQEVRDAMGMAAADAIVAYPHRLAAAPADDELARTSPGMGLRRVQGVAEPDPAGDDAKHDTERRPDPRPNLDRTRRSPLPRPLSGSESPTMLRVGAAPVAPCRQ